MWDKGKSWSLESPAPIEIEWHMTFRKFLDISKMMRADVAEKIATLDVVEMGATQMEDVASLTARFADLVSENDFAVENMTPATHWATIMLLWLRKVHQCCQAAGTSLISTHAVRRLKMRRRRLDHWKKRQREHATHEMRRSNDERDRMFAAMTNDTQHISQLTAAMPHNGHSDKKPVGNKGNNSKSSRHNPVRPIQDVSRPHIAIFHSPAKREKQVQEEKEEEIRKLGFAPTTVADRVLLQNNGTCTCMPDTTKGPPRQPVNFIVEPNFMEMVSPA